MNEYSIFVGGVFNDLIRVDTRSTPLGAIRAWIKGQTDAPTCVWIAMENQEAAKRFLEWCGKNRTKVRDELAKQNTYYVWYLDKMLDKSLTQPLQLGDDPRDTIQIEPFCAG